VARLVAVVTGWALLFVSLAAMAVGLAVIACQMADRH
jgi:hypothetical protein